MLWFLFGTNGQIVEFHDIETTFYGEPSAYNSDIVGAVCFDSTDMSAQDASVHPSHYIIQNGALVKTVTDAQLLAEAQDAQQATITKSYYAALSAGYVSVADGTSRTYPGDVNTLSELTMLRTTVLANTYPPSDVPVLDISGNHIPLTQAQAVQLMDDAQNFFMATRNKYLGYISQIQQATTVSGVQAITW